MGGLFWVFFWGVFFRVGIACPCPNVCLRREFVFERWNLEFGREAFFWGFYSGFLGFFYGVFGIWMGGLRWEARFFLQPLRFL